MGLGREMAKYASEDARERTQSYPRAMVAALPLALAQSAGDVPKGAVERATEDAINGTRPTFRRSFKLGKSKAVGRFAAAAATTPLFLSGIKDLKEAKSEDQKRRGALKVLAAGTAFGAVKGSVETTLDRGAKTRGIGKAVRGAFAGRGLYGAVGGLLTAKAVADNLRKSPKDRNLADKAKPYLVAGGLSAAEGFTESALQRGLAKSKDFRAAVAKAGGRTAGGIIGAGIVSAIASHGQEKKAEMGADPYSTYVASRRWAERADPQSVQQQVAALQEQGPLTPLRRAAVAGLVAGRKGSDAPKVRPPGTVEAGYLALAVTAPHLVLGVIDQMEPSKRDLILRDAMDRLAAQKAIEVRGADLGDEMSSAGKIYVHPKSHAAVVAHEIGHATGGPARQVLTASVAANVAHSWARGAAAALPIVCLLSSADGNFASKADLEAKADFLSRVGTVAAAVGAPKMAEEGLASVSAVRYLMRAGASRQEVAQHALTRLLPAFATYAVPFTLPFVAARSYRSKSRSAPQESS